MVKELLEKVPYNFINKGVRWVKINTPLFTKDWPEDVPHIQFQKGLDEVESRLREQRCFEGVQASLHYEGEELDLRKPIGVKDYGPSELHIRFREIEDGYECMAHTEPSRYENKKRHINATGDTDYYEGIKMTKEAFDSIGVNYA